MCCPPTCMDSNRISHIEVIPIYGVSGLDHRYNSGKCALMHICVRSIILLCLF